MSKKRKSVETEESLDDLIKLAKVKDHNINSTDPTIVTSAQLTKKQRRNKSKSEKKKVKAKDAKQSQALNSSKPNNTTKFDDDDDVNSTVQVAYPYDVEDDDHCESPLEAYEHIATYLKRIADVLKKDIATLAIYDPYYCEGNMVEHLHSLGFLNVYNKKEDFYAVQKEGRCPPYDVLVTNPPYSSKHIPKLLQFSASSNKPFFLLMPNFVYAKDYYYPSLTTTSQRVIPFYVSPTKRYSYTTPKGRRQLKSAKYTSPFPSFWYCHLGHVKSLLPLSSFMQIQGDVNKSKAICSADASKLPIAVLHDSDARKKKEKNSKKREKHKARKQLKPS